MEGERQRQRPNDLTTHMREPFAKRGRHASTGQWLHFSLRLKLLLCSRLIVNIIVVAVVVPVVVQQQHQFLNGLLPAAGRGQRS